jgi:hypothetical protein
MVKKSQSPVGRWAKSLYNPIICGVSWESTSIIYQLVQDVVRPQKKKTPFIANKYKVLPHPSIRPRIPFPLMILMLNTSSNKAWFGIGGLDRFILGLHMEGIKKKNRGIGWPGTETHREEYGLFTCPSFGDVSRPIHPYSS